ncbi:MAG TPA: hypothetical protein VF188_01510 [Longimicrobiales bacterium]
MADPVVLTGARPCGAVDCRPPAEPPAAPAIPREAQPVDYMARDYDSFLRAMLDLLPDRVPGWRDRTEADLGMAILELFAYIGDQLSYYQDRVAAEAFLRTAVQHDSVRRLLRLIDYRIDPGSAAAVLLEFQVTTARPLPAGFRVSTPGGDGIEPVVFETTVERVLFPQLNAIALAADAPDDTEGRRLTLAAELGDEFLPVGSWLYIEYEGRGEWVRTAEPVVVDTTAHTTAVVLAAPLSRRYPMPAPPDPGALVHGNGLPATHGESRSHVAEGTGLPDQTLALDFAPLTYLTEPDGTRRSTLRVEVDRLPWHEVEDFIDSGPADAHYRVSRDNDGFLTVHFGDGARGRIPERGAPIEVAYRTGIGTAGLVAAESLTQYVDPDGAITAVRNPQPSAGAVDPQPLTEAKLLGPRHIHRQDRAVVPADYERILLDGVRVGERTIAPLHAHARFQWTGSWTTAVVSVELPDRQPLAAVPDVRAAFAAALADHKLTGYDVRVEDARYAPLNIALVVHVKPNYFARHVRRGVERALSGRDDADGFFSPGRFGFGQAVYLSDLYAAALAVEGVESLEVTRFKRLGDRYPDRERDGYIPIGPLEIARCDNDPADTGQGILFIRTCGGKEG